MSSTGAGEVLVVDDTPASLKLLSELLTTAGFSVRVAPNGELALASVESALPDLILLDVRMPGLNGYEVCQRLKSNAQTAEVPVIFLSAHYDTDDKLAGFNAGAVDYISKPFAAEEVLARVRTHIHLVQVTQQLEHERASLEQKVQERTLDLELANLFLTQEIESRQALEASTRLCAIYFTHSSDAVFISAVDGRLLAVNPALIRLSGFESEELLAKNMAELVSAGRGATVAELLTAALAGSGFCSDSLALHCKNGTTLLLQLALTAIRNELDEVEHWLGILTSSADSAGN